MVNTYRSNRQTQLLNAKLLDDLPLQRINQGKVRDVYAVDADRLLLVATDRISAFDVVMGEAIPDKGRVRAFDTSDPSSTVRAGSRRISH